MQQGSCSITAQDSKQSEKSSSRDSIAERRAREAGSVVVVVVDTSAKKTNKPEKQPKNVSQI
jgi:hypothetical protein